MKLFICLLIMVGWSALVAAAMYLIGFQNHLHDVLWSLGAAIALLIGLVGNVWIFFLVMKEKPWQWHTN